MSTSPSDRAPAPSQVPAQYFDGRRAKPYPVTLTLTGGVLRMLGEGFVREDPVATLRVSEPMGQAPRLIAYPDGAHCEVRDHEGIAALLAAGDHSDGWVVRMQSRWRWAAVAVLVAAISIAAGYRWLLPAAAELIAHQLPDMVVAQLGAGTLSLLDRSMLAPTKLEPARQQELRDAFARLVAPQGRQARYELLFRDARHFGPNAFALPDGTIVMTDQLVALAEHDEELIAVLAHEAGHVQRRHGLRLFIESSIVTFVVSWYVGDFSSVVAAAPTLLLQARYSREHELDADRYGAQLLAANGISPRRLATMLLKLEQWQSTKSGTGVQPDDLPKRERSSLGEYLSSHPATRERIEALNAAR